MIEKVPEDKLKTVDLIFTEEESVMVEELSRMTDEEQWSTIHQDSAKNEGVSFDNEESIRSYMARPTYRYIYF